MIFEFNVDYNFLLVLCRNLLIFALRFRYKNCYEEAINGLDETLSREKGFNRDDHIHGSLLVLNELFRISNIHWERYFEELMQKLEFSQNSHGEVTLIVVFVL